MEKKQMKLASYGDMNNYGIVDFKESMEKLKDILGFYPLLAVSAENEIDFTAQSILLDLKKPDTLCFFDSSSTKECVPISVSALVELCNCPDKENWKNILNPQEKSDTVYAVHYTDETTLESIQFPLIHYSDFQIRWTEDVPEDSKLELNSFLKKLKKDTESLLKPSEREDRYAIKKAMERSGLLTTVYRLLVEGYDEEDRFFIYKDSINKDLQRLFKSTKGYQIKDLRRTLYSQITNMFIKEEIINKYK